MKNKEGPRVLLFDIETAPIIAHVWGLWENNVGLNQIVKDWHLLSWSAKWLDSKEIMYKDQRHAKKIDDDSAILRDLWKLLDEADIVITQNGKRFDEKKVNARFILNGMKPTSPFKHIDMAQIAKTKFGFTSNKLAYMTDKLNKKYKKLEHKKYPGHELWTECLAGNLDAWKEMEIYNKYDVLALEELYTTMIPWSQSIDFNLYTDNVNDKCNCGGDRISKGFRYTSRGKYRRYVCKSCGAMSSDSIQLLSKEKRKSLKSAA